MGRNFKRRKGSARNSEEPGAKTKQCREAGLRYFRENGQNEIKKFSGPNSQDQNQSTADVWQCNRCLLRWPMNVHQSSRAIWVGVQRYTERPTERWPRDGSGLGVASWGVDGLVDQTRYGRTEEQASGSAPQTIGGLAFRYRSSVDTSNAVGGVVTEYRSGWAMTQCQCVRYLWVLGCSRIWMVVGWYLIACAYNGTDMA